MVFIRRGARMKTFILLVISLFISSNLFAANQFKIIDRGDQEVTIPGYTVPAGGFNSSFVVIKNIGNLKPKDVIGVANIGGGYGNYKSRLPITSGYGNSNSFTVIIAFSKSDKEIICVSESWNHGVDEQVWDDLTFDLSWYLLK